MINDLPHLGIVCLGGPKLLPEKKNSFANIIVKKIALKTGRGGRAV